MPIERQSRKRAKPDNGKPANGASSLSPRQLREIIESASDLIALTDTEGRLLYLNPAGRKLAGLQESEEVQGTSLADYHTPREAKIVSNIGLLCAQHAGVWAGASVLRGKNGRESPVHETILAHKSEQGDVEGYSVIARDLSESPWQEEAPWAGAKLRRLLEAAPGAMVMANPRGEVVLVNAQAERWLGYSRRELLGKKVEMRFPELCRAPQQDELERQGLAAAIRTYAGSLAASGKPRIELESPPDFPRLSREAEWYLFSVVLETLESSCKLQAAGKINGRLASSPQEIVLELQNEIRPTLEIKLNSLQAPASRAGVGILGLAEGLRQLGGQLEICAGRSCTRIRATLPRTVASESTAASKR